jgi:hypothetical protein
LVELQLQERRDGAGAVPNMPLMLCAYVHTFDVT